MRYDPLDKARSFAEFVERRYVETVETGVTGDWMERDVALGLLWRALFHFKILDGSATDLADVEADLKTLVGSDSFRLRPP